MKLLIFSPYYPPHTGGLESHADEFNEHLSKTGVSITIFTTRIPKDTPEQGLKHNNVKIIRFPAFEIIPNYPLPAFWSPRFWKLLLSLYKESFDITISRTRFFFTSFIALFFAKTKQTKFIHIEHGSDFVQLSSKFKSLMAKAYDYTLGWLIFKSSDLNISISKAVQNFIYKFDKRPSPIIYRGLNIKEIDTIPIDSDIQTKYSNKTIITFVGRLYKWKGVENSIQAVKQLPQEIKNKIIFLIVGDGEDLKRLKELSKNENCIEILGNVPREKAISILKASNIYIHSAYPGGGLSTSLLEAMYCNNAVIATPNEGANEIIEDNITGLLIDRPYTENTKREIIKLLNNAKMIEFLSKSAKKTISKKITWYKSIKQYQNIFKNL